MDSKRPHTARAVATMTVALAFAAVSLPWRVSAQELRPPFLAPENSAWEAGPRLLARMPAADRGFDVVRYGLELRLPMTDPSFGGVESLLVLPRQTMSSFVLDAASISVGTVASNRGVVSATSDTFQQQLTLTLAQPASAGDSVLFIIPFQRVGSPGKGWYYYPKGASDPPRDVTPAGDTIGYTMSEPSDAHFWFPCVDDPASKARSAGIAVTVPQGYTAAANGTLVSAQADPVTGWVRYVWNESKPITPYLMCVTVSKFSHVTASPTYRTSDGRDIPIGYYVWPSSAAQVRWFLPSVVDMVDFFSRTFREYPFEKYEMTGVAPFFYGGMEHQTLTTLHSAYVTNTRLVDHELAHQWWGDYVTCGTWKDIWLNEGFASYCEALYAEHVSGAAGLNQVMQGFLGGPSFASIHGRQVYDPPMSELFNLAEYYKGAWVLHMLRNVIGDSSFFSVLRTYSGRFPYGNAVTRDFQDVVNAVTGLNYDWFFNEWILQPGYPVYDVAWGYYSAEGQQAVQVFITQQPPLQSYPVFRMPIELKFSGSGSDTTVVVVDSLLVQSFEVRLSFHPTQLSVDPGNKILKVLRPLRTIVAEKGSSPRSFRVGQNYPNPFNPSTTIPYQVPVRSRVTYQLYNVLGQPVAGGDEGIQGPGFHTVHVDGSALPSGIYFYEIKAAPLEEGGRVWQDVRKMTLMK